MQLPMLTLNVLTHETDILNLDEDPVNIDEPDLRERTKYLQKCKYLT